MLVNDIAVISQALMSFIFMIRYTMLVAWWRDAFKAMLMGLVACLFTITFTLALVNSNEGLGNSPIPVTVGRLGFTIVLVFGVLMLEFKQGIFRDDEEGD